MTCDPPVAECDAFWRQVFARAGLSKWKATKSDRKPCGTSQATPDKTAGSGAPAEQSPAICRNAHKCIEVRQRKFGAASSSLGCAWKQGRADHKHTATNDDRWVSGMVMDAGGADRGLHD